MTAIHEHVVPPTVPMEVDIENKLGGKETRCENRILVRILSGENKLWVLCEREIYSDVRQRTNCT